MCLGLFSLRADLISGWVFFGLVAAPVGHGSSAIVPTDTSRYYIVTSSSPVLIIPRVL